MSSLPNNMCETYSTTNVGSSRLNILNSYQRNNFGPFLKYITKDYIEEETNKTPLNFYSNLISTTVIPKLFNKNLQSYINLNINTSTKNNYIIKVIFLLKEIMNNLYKDNAFKKTNKLSLSQLLPHPS